MKLRTLSATAAALLATATPLYVVLQRPVAAAEPAPVSSAVAAIRPSNPPQTAAQRKAHSPRDKSARAIVDAFHQLAFFDHDPVAAMKRYLAPDFIEHYPDLAGEGPGTDKEKTIRFFETRGWKKSDTKEDRIYQLIAEKDRVAVFHHVVSGPADPGTAYVDIFRVANGLIVEHWAVGQPVSPKISPQHNMF